MRRRLFNLTAAMSLLLCLATMVLWVRSYFVGDRIVWCSAQYQWGVDDVGGRLEITRYQPSGPVEIETRWLRVLPPSSQDEVRHPHPMILLCAREPRNSQVISPFDGFGVWSHIEEPEIGGHKSLLVSIPVWITSTLTVVLPLLWLYAGWPKSLVIGVCRFCGYDLTGNTSGVCPECGTVIAGEAGAKA